MGEQPSVNFPAVVAGQIGVDEIQTVNARELHGFLQVGKKFADWIKDRISQYDFEQDRDFVTYEAASQNGEAGNRGLKIEYAITLDMAKELSMVERNDQGKRARQYFIECERRVQAVDPIQALNDPAAMRGLLLSYSEKVLALQATNAELAPKADALDRIATADGSLNVTEAAKALQMRPKDLFSYLKEHGWIYKRANSPNWLGYQPKTSSGLLEHKVTTVLRADGSEKITEQVRVTPKGLTKLAALIQPFSVAA